MRDATSDGGGTLALIERSDLIAKLGQLQGFLDFDNELLIPLHEVMMLVNTIPAVEQKEDETNETD